MEGRGEGVSGEEGETPLDPPLSSAFVCASHFPLESGSEHRHNDQGYHACGRNR